MAYVQTASEHMYELPQADLGITNRREASMKEAQEIRSTNEVQNNGRKTMTTEIVYRLLIVILLVLLVVGVGMIFLLKKEWKQELTDLKDRLIRINETYKTNEERTRKEFDSMRHLLHDSRQNATNGLKTSDAYLIDLIQQSNSITRNQTYRVSEKLIKLVTDIASSTLITMRWNKAGNNYYYKKFSESVNYTTAEDRCKQFGANLAAQILRDPLVTRNMRSNGYMNDFNVIGIPWIGIADTLHDGIWRWVDGGTTSTLTLRWIPGKPDNGGGNEHCGHLYYIKNQKFEINDIHCSKSLQYICEKKISDVLTKI